MRFATQLLLRRQRATRAQIREISGAAFYAVFYRLQSIGEPIGELLTWRVGGRTTPKGGNARPQVKGQNP